MIIDTSDIATENDRFIRASEQTLQNIEFAHASIDVLRAAAYLPLNEADDITVLRLGIRLINSAGASGSDAMNGYYQPAAAHIRDIIEVSFLLDLFRRERGEISAWRNASDETLWQKFRPEKLKSRLDHYDGGKPSYRKSAYKFFSEQGTHAKPLAVGLISPDMNTMVGPFPDERRVVGLSFDLARHLSAGTAFLIRCIGHHQLDEADERVSKYLRAGIDFFDAVEHFKKRTNLQNPTK
ncbi:hypothetical protein [Rhizobium sp.]|uniref:hypothetical protein n=1 Tax=Rhizobium sp. TaxID=391 RepID=UPI0028AF78F1